MIIRTIDGDIIIIKRSDFASDVSYNKKIYSYISPFTTKYPTAFLSEKCANNGKK